MIEHEDELICDFAQYYNILNWRGLPLRLAAILASGLPQSSRTMMAVSGVDLTISQALQAAAVDRLSLLIWQNTKDGQKNKNKPKSILSELTDRKEKPQAFTSADAFEEMRKKIIEG